MMTGEDLSLEEKAKRTRELLTSFYGDDSSRPGQLTRVDTLKAIDTPAFDPEKYMNSLVSKTNVEGLLQKHVQMAAEIKNLDSDLQMLVYENYNKFISATDTIRRMKDNVVGMESNMETLLEKITSVQLNSDSVNASLCERREHIEKLNRTRRLLRKVQFIYDLPSSLRTCIKSGEYAEAVKYYIGALPLLKLTYLYIMCKAYGDSSFASCKKESDEAISLVIEHLQARLFADSEPVEARAEAVVLLKQLGFQIDNLKTKLLEVKLEHFLLEIQAEARQPNKSSTDLKKSSEGATGAVESSDSLVNSKKDSIGEFAKMVTAYRIIFPNSERRLTEVAIDLLDKHFAQMQHSGNLSASASKLVSALRMISIDVDKMHDVLPEAQLWKHATKAAENAIRQHVSNTFKHLLSRILGLLSTISSQKRYEESEKKSILLQEVLENGKRSLLQGILDAFVDFKELLDDNLEILIKLKSIFIDWVQRGFQSFFKELVDTFLGLAQGALPDDYKHSFPESIQTEKVSSGFVLVLSQLCLYIEHIVIPRATEEMACAFPIGTAKSYEDGPAFIPAEICRLFRSAGHKLLHAYIMMQVRKLSSLIRKSIETPNWLKQREPRDVRMFADLLLQELKAMEAEVEQVLNRGSARKHRRSDSTGSSASSWSNAVRDDRSSHSSTNRARSQLLESHVAKLFKQKIEIFTKLESTQESVLSTIVKMCLKSFQEYVRLETFCRSGFQQIQLDVQYLREPLKHIIEDEAVIDFLLDEVCAAAAERCFDPVPLEPAILDRLIHAKLARRSEQSVS